MSEAYEPAGLRACLAITAELRAAAVDASSDLSMSERRALASLASAVEAQAAHRAGVQIDWTSAEAAVAEAMVVFEDARGRPLQGCRLSTPLTATPISASDQSATGAPGTIDPAALS